MSQTITGTVAIAASTHVSPITITTSTPHGLSTGNTVRIAGHLANYSANGDWVVTVLNGTQFTLAGSSGVAAGSATGTVTTFPVSGQAPSDGDDDAAASVVGMFQALANQSGFLAAGVVGNKRRDCEVPLSSWSSITGTALVSAVTASQVGPAAYDPVFGLWITGYQDAGGSPANRLNFAISYDGQTWAESTDYVSSLGAVALQAIASDPNGTFFAVCPTNANKWLAFNNYAGTAGVSQSGTATTKACVFYFPAASRFVEIEELQSGGSFTGKAFTSAPATTIGEANGVTLSAPTDISTSLPAGWASGTDHVAGFVSALSADGTKALVGLTGTTPGTDAGRLMTATWSGSAVVFTDITSTSAPTASGASVQAVAYSAPDALWAVLTNDGTYCMLSVSPDLASWTRVPMPFDNLTNGTPVSEMVIDDMAIVGGVVCLAVRITLGYSLASQNTRVYVSTLTTGAPAWTPTMGTSPNHGIARFFSSASRLLLLTSDYAVLAASKQVPVQ